MGHRSGNLGDSSAESNVGHGDDDSIVNNWARDHFCDNLEKNMAAFALVLRSWLRLN